MNAGIETRPPRGALLVIAVGLIACVAAALLATDEPIGASDLEWEAKSALPSSKPAPVPGGGGTMRIENAGLRGTAPNFSGYKLFRVAATLTIPAGTPIGHGKVDCVTQTSRQTIVARTPKKRASYPRPSEELVDQPVPSRVTVEFNAHGTDLASVELNDAFHRFGTEPGIKVDWAPYRETRQEWEWGLPAGQPQKPLELAFASIWRTTATPAAQIACTLTTGAGSAGVRTSGSLPG